MCASTKYSEIATAKAKAMISAFTPADGIGEYGIVAYATDSSIAFADQLREVQQLLKRAQDQHCPDSSVVFKRYFLSDVTNQANLVADDQCACSVIGQPPLMGGKVAVWAYLQQGVKVRCLTDGMSVAEHGAYRHIWTGGATAPGLNSELATLTLLGDYVTRLSNLNCDLMNNCLRTWFFVRDIDTHYRGVVTGRNDVFRHSGLTQLTHFIASTGIGGSNADTRALVTMDAYAVDGIVPGQVTYLQAPTHLNPTMQYGVAFERGTAIDYGDRRHVLISGTASIDNRGQIVHAGDIVGQTHRMLENVEALLSEAACGWHDLMHSIVYVRDICDYATVSSIIAERLPGLPVVIVEAPVCRAGWLVEMECMAIAPASTAYPDL